MKNTEKRQDYNRAIIDMIRMIVVKYPDLRFTQILSMLGLDNDAFYEEPDDTCKRIKEKYDYIMSREI